MKEIVLNGYETNIAPYDAIELGTFDSYGEEQLQIVKEQNWENLNVIATFNPPNKKPVQVVVDSVTGIIKVPKEATADLYGVGTIVFVGLADGVQRISTDVKYNVRKHSNANGTEPAEPTPSVVQQILTEAQNANVNSAKAKKLATDAKDIAKSVRDDADNGKFNGKDGAKGDKGDVGTTPQLKIGEDNLWNVSYDNGATWVSLGVKATGDAGEDGVDGMTPHIGENGNWWLGDTDTGVSAKGPQGPPGEIPEDYPQIRKDVSQLKEDVFKKIDKPSVADEGKTPRAKNGNVEWVEQGLPSDSQTETAVTNWLNDHPEATTTVQDGSITDIKIEESLLNRINQSYNPMLINIKSNVNVGQTPFLDGHTYDLCGHTITIEKAIGNNLSFRNGKIVLPSEYRFTDVHGSFVLENIVIESDFWSAHNIYCDDIRITNCKFTNIAFGFPDSKQVYINNNRFICTVNNSASTVGSEEFIHINPSTPLDVCVISNNYFYGSQNDCIDCFPAGFVTKIIGNTFDECSDTIIELKSHYRDQGHPNGNTEQSVDGIIISENVFKNVKRRTTNTVCINIYATDERTGIVDKDFSFYPKVTISDCIFDNSNNEKVTCIRIAAEGGVVLVSNCRTFAKNSQDDDDANGVFVKGESSCTVYISNCYTTTKNFLTKGASTVGVMTARVSNCYGRYITDFVDNIYMNNTKIHRIFSKKGNVRILTNCELTDNYTPNSDSVLIGCFVKNIFSPSVTDGINVKITNSFYTGSISSSSLIESVGNVKLF